VLPSEDDIKRRFGEYVSGANACTAASECAVASSNCPLGCFVPVRADRKTDVEKRARELIAEYERGGRRCDYDCVPPGQLACLSGRCAFSDSAPDAAASRRAPIGPRGAQLGARSARSGIAVCDFGMSLRSPGL
jgi:hypothetical protein